MLTPKAAYAKKEEKKLYILYIIYILKKYIIYMYNRTSILELKGIFKSFYR